MGKLLPVPYPGQSMDEYREQLVNFQKNYWSFLKPSKGGSKFIPSPPLTLIKKTKEILINFLKTPLKVLEKPFFIFQLKIYLTTKFFFTSSLSTIFLSVSSPPPDIV